MSQSSPQKKRTVRVLFYGQSLTQEIWSVWLGNYIREKYPNANLVITNLAVGYEADLLWKPAATDIPGFYPDLMIFQNYGPPNLVEQIIDTARRRTTTDILIQTDHINHVEDMSEPTDPNTPGGLPYWPWRNYVALPDIANRYGGELAHVRDYWKEYLRDYNINVPDMLRDAIHPNWEGNQLLTDLLKPYLREDLSFGNEEWVDAEKNYRIGSDVNWSDDTLNLDFTGNRVDVVSETSGDDPVEVRIDGRKPSEFPELYQFTRPDWYPNTYWLSIMRILSERPLIDEDWTAKVIESTTNTGLPYVRFQITGSKTGFDGEGDITHPFVSNSGRVKIDTSDWLMIYWAVSYYPILSPLPVGHEIHWKSVFRGKDEFVPSAPDPNLESTVTLAQGLGNGRHTLTLKRKGPAPISTIRVFNPLARKQNAKFTSPSITSTKREGGTVSFEVAASGRYVLESSPDCRAWKPLSAPLSDLQVTVQLETGAQFFRARALE